MIRAVKGVRGAASHSPILLACPEARIYSFDRMPITPIDYEQTDHYQVYKDFMEDRKKFLTIC